MAAKKKSGPLSFEEIKAQANLKRPNTAFNGTDDYSAHIEFAPTGIIELDNRIGGGFPKGGIVDLYGAEGSGKCLVGGTLVSTEFGLVPIEEFASLIDPDSPIIGEHPMQINLWNYRTELEPSVAFTMNGPRKVKTIIAQSGRRITSTLNHPHLVLRDGVVDWVETKDLREYDQLIVNPGRPPAEPLFDVTYNDSYIMGVLSAGVEMQVGSPNGSFGMVAKYPTEKYNEIVGPYNGDFVAALREGTKANATTEAFRALSDRTGWLPCPADQSEIPLSILTGNREVILGFLTGLIDALGDTWGHLTVRSQKLSQQLLVLLDSVGIACRIRETSLDGPLQNPGWILEMDDGEQGSAVFDGTSFTRFDSILKIEDQEKEFETYDFSMSETHSFIANGIVTHNTALALTFAANLQKEGGRVVFFNAENAYNEETAIRAGVDVDRLEVFNVDVAEEVFEYMRAMVKSGEVDAIIVDSFAGLVPEAVINGEIGDSHVAVMGRLASQALAILTSEMMQYESDMVIIFVNQTRANIGGMGPVQTMVTGGKALKFYSSLRMKVARVERITRGGEIVGQVVEFTLDKSRYSKPFQKFRIDLNYDGGYSNEGGILDACVESGILQKSGNWHVDTSTGEKFGNGREAAKEYLKENPDYAQALVDRLRDL